MTIDNQEIKSLALACDPAKCADEAEEGRRLAEFYSELTPEAVLALLAEIEQLAFEPAKHSRRLIDQLKAENEDYKSGQERYEQIIEDLKAENAQLKNQEIELRCQNELLLRGGEVLKEQAEALRKDAERYRWLRDPDNQCAVEDDSDYYMPPMICGYAEHEDILTHEALDKAIDAALAKEASHG